MTLHDQVSLQSCHFNLEREKVLFEIISNIRESLDLEVILQTTIQELRQLLAVDRVGVVRLEAATGWDEGEFIAETVLPRFDSALAMRVRDHCFGKQYAEAYQNGRIQAVEDIYNAGLSECHIEILSQFQVRANLLVPLLQGKELWGLLCIHQCSGPRQWTSDDIELVSKIAVHLGIAIQHAELLTQTQKQSLELNQSLQNLKSVHTQLA
ncbi:MAG: GAF domain-containing protein, partial [Cyanobacteria bacterium P01_H01_bin.152]